MVVLGTTISTWQQYISGHTIYKSLNTPHIEMNLTNNGAGTTFYDEMAHFRSIRRRLLYELVAHGCQCVVNQSGSEGLL